MTVKNELLSWIDSLPDDAGIYIDDGGLALRCDVAPGAYLEVGGIADDLVLEDNTDG